MLMFWVSIECPALGKDRCFLSGWLAQGFETSSDLDLSLQAPSCWDPDSASEHGVEASGARYE